ncbi:hypothetical protein DY000_02014423 [Brassica cretica]|uniref:Uncharacterized protein n=1 Tax=Brassica cretica TaxID=69181 RepID=A0ABQ7CS62_BRACR|nr:hypothetical protein DY000_02014423 [Brassica cretica]
MLGKENFLGISIKVISSLKGVSAYESGLLFRMGGATPGSLSTMDCMALSLSENIWSEHPWPFLAFRRHSWEVRACPGVGCFQIRHRANLSLESTLLVGCRVMGLVLVSEGKILRFELDELLGALLQLLGVFVELFLQDLELRGKLGIRLFPSSMQPGYLTLQIVDLPLEFGFSLGSFG